jgi:hypothetical protein
MRPAKELAEERQKLRLEMLDAIEAYARVSAELALAFDEKERKRGTKQD